MKPDTGGKHDTLDHYEGGDGCFYRRLRMGPDDLTPTVKRYPPEKATRRYHRNCFGCWQGVAHSEAYHDAHEVGPRYG